MVLCIVLTSFCVAITLLRYGMKICFTGAIEYSPLFYERVVSIFLWLYCVFSPALARDGMVQTALDVIARDYLWDYSPHEALLSAAEQLEEVIPWLIVEYQEDSIHLIHGEKGVFAVLPIPSQSIDIMSEIFAIEQSILESGYRIDDDVRIDVELLRGYMNALDRYSTIMTRDSLTRFNERIQGQLTGIGCRVQRSDEGIRISEVFPDSPAYSGGIHKNDIVTHIDGASIKGVSLNDAVDRLRGPIHSRVAIRFVREGEENEVTLQRAKVRIPNVRLYIEDGIAQIVIENFSSQTTRGVQKALKEIRNTKGIKGMILDLRGNTGGSMWQSCKTVDAFLSTGLVLRTEGKNGKSVSRLMKSYEAEKDQELGLPMIVLVNSRSASASEIVAGALKAHKRVLIIGQKTHGKGVVQMPHTIRTKSDPVKMKLTVAQYLLHHDFSVHEQKGVAPDIWLERYRFSEEGFAHERKADEDFEGPVLLYAKEESGWRLGGIVRDDYPLQFARKILLQSASVHSDLSSLIEEEQKIENNLMNDIFAAREINWSSEGVVQLDKLVVSKVKAEKVLVGEQYHWEMEIYNPTQEPVPKVYASFSSISDYMPWSGEHISIGTLQPQEKKTIVLEGEIPIGLSGSMEEIGLSLHSGEQVHSVRTQNIEIIEQSTPKLLVRAQIFPGIPNIMDVSVENLSNRAVRDLVVQLSLPNIKEVENLGDSLLEQSILEKGDVASIQFQFQSAKDLEDLPELKLEVQAEHRSSKIEYIENPINFLSEQLILAPVIHTDIPTTITQERLDIIVDAEDDGSVVETSLWVDGDKKGWQGDMTKWTHSLKMNKGRHRIDILARDDQGLESRSIYYVYVTP
ncbi:MAG: hypothetical protein CL916_05370 [Deltaproteobacteria bacterium]|nr:hypothetical protein [Deltaproteobacteria bacterium]